MSTNPRIAGRFRVDRPIGEGGMGTVYLAWDSLLDRPVAIKLLKKDSDASLRTRFAREARTAAGLRHVNIVQIFDVGMVDGRQFIAMEYIPGETLAEMIRRRAPLGFDHKLQLMEQVCSGLDHAHKRGIIHRDVKPANLIVDPDGTLKILDFGIARLGGSAMTHAGTLVGTVNYMSPEQVSGRRVDARSDIFAVGAVLYELLAHRKAFDGSMIQALMHIVNDRPEPLQAIVPDIDPDVVRIVERALDKDAATRYQDLRAMRRDLSAIRGRMTMREREVPIVVIGYDGPTVTVVGSQFAVAKAAQIDALLANANAAIDASDFDAAQAALNKAAALDPMTADVSRVVERLRGRAADVAIRAERDEVDPAVGPNESEHAKPIPQFAVQQSERHAVPLVAQSDRIVESLPREAPAVEPSIARQKELFALGAGILAVLTALTVASAIAHRYSPSARPAAAKPPPVAAALPKPPGSQAANSAAAVPVVIDAIPWARLTITPKSPDVRVDISEQTTPCIVSLPPGDYSVRLVNESVGPPSTQPLHVSTAQNQRVTFRLVAYDPDNVVNTILGAR